MSNKVKKIEGLPLNYESTDSKDFIEILNKVSEFMGGVPNMGTFADITSITQSNDAIATINNKFIKVNIKHFEIPHKDLIVTENISDPFKYDFDTLTGKKGSNIPSQIAKSIKQNFKDEENSFVGFLDGTIENHQCEPTEDCYECHGNGRCKECGGSGNVDCHNCHGNGRCTSCNGTGKSRCTECGGDGRCRYCDGSGKIMCPDCHLEGKIWDGNHFVTCKKCGGAGFSPCTKCSSNTMNVTRFVFGASKRAAGSGKCQVCEGTGYLQCTTCSGTGNCTSCNGSGKEECNHCHGDGSCPTCDGTGKLTCRRCAGSGWYQTFSVFHSSWYSKQHTFVSDNELQEGLELASKRPVYNSVFRRWKYKDIIEFDNRNDLKDLTDNTFGTEEAYSLFENEYAQTMDKRNNDDIPFESTLELQKVPVTKIIFKMNNQDYQVNIMGDDGVVMCDDLPDKIELYKPDSFFKKLKLSLTKRKRHLSYIKLAAYIFQCDGKSIDESHVLNTFVDALKLSPSKQEKLKEDLKKYNSEMSYELLRKEVSSLFSSKKTLTFVWQCMAVDKKVSTQEADLFNKIVSEYKIEQPEIESMKRFASKYSLLNDSSLVSEYLS